MAKLCKVRIWKVGLINLWIWKPRRKTNIWMNKINDISHVLFFILFDINKAKYITLTFILLNLTLLCYLILPAINGNKMVRIRCMGNKVF